MQYRNSGLVIRAAVLSMVAVSWLTLVSNRATARAPDGENRRIADQLTYTAGDFKTLRP